MEWITTGWLEDGQSLEVFKNMDHGGWYRLIE
jgi:hypothetical protein